jgi:hypothetical protein
MPKELFKRIITPGILENKSAANQAAMSTTLLRQRVYVQAMGATTHLTM